MMRSETVGRVLIRGSATGRLLSLGAPISFWGGVDPRTGAISDPRHPNHGRTICGTVLAVPATIGSSSSSAVMLELLRNGVAPAGLLLGHHDGILVLGVIVARELGYPTIPVVELPPAVLARLATGDTVQITERGLALH
jgi:predicted aconitase with swiveling domain